MIYGVVGMPNKNQIDVEHMSFHSRKSRFVDRQVMSSGSPPQLQPLHDYCFYWLLTVLFLDNLVTNIYGCSFVFLVWIFKRMFHITKVSFWERKKFHRDWWTRFGQSFFSIRVEAIQFMHKTHCNFPPNFNLCTQSTLSWPKNYIYASKMVFMAQN